MDIKDHTMDSLVGVEIPVGNAGFVKLVDWMGGDKRVVEAARQSYGSGTKIVRDDEALIDYLFRNQHVSPSEMPQITLSIKLPIFVMRQLVRHRAAHLNEMSLRYSEAFDEAFYPDAFRVNDKLNKQSSSVKDDDNFQFEARELYNKTISYCKDTYDKLLKLGVAREQARMILQVAEYTEVTWCIDLRNLLSFLNQRTREHAQLEMQDYANVINQIVQKWTPVCHKAYMEYIRESMTLSRSEINLVAYLSKLDSNGLGSVLQYPEALSTINALKDMGIIGEEYNLYSKRTKTQDLLAKLDMLGLEGVLPWFLDEFKNLQQSILESEDK